MAGGLIHSPGVPANHTRYRHELKGTGLETVTAFDRLRPTATNRQPRLDLIGETRSSRDVITLLKI